MTVNAFWDDLNNDLQDPEFAETFWNEIEIINETDRLVNEYLDAQEEDYG